MYIQDHQQKTQCQRTTWRRFRYVLKYKGSLNRTFVLVTSIYLQDTNKHHPGQYMYGRNIDPASGWLKQKQTTFNKHLS